MSSILLRTALYTVAAILLSAVLLALPLKTIALLTKPFSMKTFGIRKIKRWHTHTDTLANSLLWISVLFCLICPWLPYAPILYLIWLTLTWLCAVSRAVRLTQVRVRSTKAMVIFFVNLIYFTGLFGAIGLFNHYELWIKTFEFANAILDGQGLQPTFYLTSTTPGAWLVQELLLLWPLVNLWGQFKYMRLENTFRASNIVTYGVRSSLVALILIVCAGLGPAGLQFIYQQPLLEEGTAEKVGYPLDRIELREKLADPQTPESVSPEAPAPADPNTPAADPNAPAVDPNTPAVDPNAPAVDPNTPAVDPGADPAAQPPAEQVPAEAQQPAEPEAYTDPGYYDEAAYYE